MSYLLNIIDKKFFLLSLFNMYTPGVQVYSITYEKIGLEAKVKGEKNIRKYQDIRFKKKISGHPF